MLARRRKCRLGGAAVSRRQPKARRPVLVTGRGDHHSQLAVAAETIVTDTAVSTYRYDPFGQTTHATGAEAELHRWRFAGAYLDATGLYKIGQRYYHPGWGRWTQPDPIYSPVDPKLWNPYTYVGNDPINYIDPTGTIPVRCLMREFLGVAPPTWEGGEPLVWGRPDFSGWEFNPLSLAINVVQAGASWSLCVRLR